jgi:GAF domain-containing protein
VVSFIDTSQDESSRAQSIVAQDIRSAICAPLVVGDAVLGVLYLDFQAFRGAVTHEDVHLVAQIARFAAVKLDDAAARRSDREGASHEELRTAYVVQSRLLPAKLPEIDGYAFRGRIVPRGR